MEKDKNFAPIISIIRYPSDHLLCFHTSQSLWKSEKAKLKCTFDNICSIYREFRPWTCIHDFLIPLFFHHCWTDQFQNIIATVVFRGPIFRRQCFQIPLDLILSYHFIIKFNKRKKLIFYYIFDIPNKNSMGGFWAESIRLASQATERFYAFWDRANLDWN